MQPHILIDHLASYFKLPDWFLVLLLDFLTNRIQQVQDEAFKHRLTPGLHPVTLTLHLVHRQQNVTRGQLLCKILG